MRRKIKNEDIVHNSSVKTMPLSVALDLISAGSTFAAIDKIQVDIGNGKIIGIDVDMLNSNYSYKTAVQAALKDAFENSRMILIHDENLSSWLDFGEYAREGVTINEMLENPAQFAGVPEEDLYTD